MEENKDKENLFRADLVPRGVEEGRERREGVKMASR